MELWKLQGFGLVLLAVLARIVEQKAAMRGCKTNPLPRWFDQFLRVAFLGVLAGPSVWALDSYTPTKFPILSSLLAAYMIPYADLVEQCGGRENLIARRFPVWKWLARYLSLKIVKTAELKQKQAYIFGLHPHSVMPFGSMIAFNNEVAVPDLPDSNFSELFPGIDFRVLAATFCFYIPGYRDLLLFGGVVDAARYSAQHVLASGKSLVLVPGGATEALHCKPDVDVVYLKRRRGFVKLALETGASLVPVFSFNENNTYGLSENKMLDGIKKKFQSIFGISMPLVTNIMPKAAPITVVVGAPIPCPKVDGEPSDEMVVKYLDIYIESLTELYNTNKDKYNMVPKPDLKVI